MKHEYLLLGEVVRPQGIRGEVKLRHYTDGPERFLDLETVYREEKGGYVPIRVTGARVNKDDVYLTLEGVDDRNAAERMRGADKAPEQVAAEVDAVTADDVRRVLSSFRLSVCYTLTKEAGADA